MQAFLRFLVSLSARTAPALIALPLALSAPPRELMESSALSTSGLVAVFLAVWGATDVARSGQKLLAMFISTGKEKGQGLVEYALRDLHKLIGKTLRLLKSAIMLHLALDSAL
jgi:hypothetical protein